MFINIFHVVYPAEILHFSHQSPERLKQLAREALLVRLYDLGDISSARAAELLGMRRREFLDLLGAYHVSVFDEDLDIVEELRHSDEACCD